MPEKYEGPLDYGKIENINPTSTVWTPRTPKRFSRWSVDFVRPEFINTLRSSSPKSPKKPVRKTAWLDGLRGFAAFMVFLHHNQLWAHGLHGNLRLENAFGFEGKHYYAALPFVRHFFSGGHFAVSIFFVISGYVLSVKSLSLIQKGQLQPAADTVGSALFRRWLRLYLPIMGVTFVWMTVRHFTDVWVDFGQRSETYREDLWLWYTTFKNYSFVFLTGENFEFPITFNAHLWSIPIESRGSIIIYTTLSALSRCTRNARLWCEAALIYYFLYIVDGYYGAMFIAGMLLCDLDLMAQEDGLPRVLGYLEGFKELIFFHLFVLAMVLGGVPSCDASDSKHDFSKQPGWRWLSKLKPQAVYDMKWFYLFWAAFLTVASVPRLPLVRAFFESRFCQYLGRISFALYMMHGYVLWVVGDRVYAAVGMERSVHKEHLPGWLNKFPISTKGPFGLEPAFCAAMLVIAPITFYAAEVVTKLLDEPSVKFSGWLYRKTLAPQVSPTPKD